MQHVRQIYDLYDRFITNAIAIVLNNFISSQEKNMKTRILIALFAAAFMIMATSASAQQCGAGKIVDIKEGGWNSDDFMIKIDGANANQPTLWNGFVRFSASELGENRLNAIRRIAGMAFALNASVWTYSHNGTCASATEMSVLQ